MRVLFSITFVLKNVGTSEMCVKWYKGLVYLKEYLEQKRRGTLSYSITKNLTRGWIMKILTIILHVILSQIPQIKMIFLLLLGKVLGPILNILYPTLFLITMCLPPSVLSFHKCLV